MSVKTKMLKYFITLACAVVLTGCATFPAADGQKPLPERVNDLEARLAELERQLEARQQLGLVNDMAQVTEQQRVLTGRVDEHGHELQKQTQRQRDMYADLDRRLQVLEGGAASQSAPTDTVGQIDGSEEQAYEAAFNMLKEGRYTQAADAFAQFIRQYPQSRYAGNAQYWLGEAKYVTRDFDTALAEFERVVQGFPKSAKVPDALLKIGYIHYEKSQWKSAQAYLEQVIRDHPGSSAADLARQRLGQMRREGRLPS
ncbi:MAG: tol-pal system protein YbgF [Pseudomonadota bacterium]|nr:tol-pal system protein YbgF [Pseudomonadota bacterium]